MIHYRGNRKKQGYQFRNTRSTSPWVPILIVIGVLLAAFLLFRFSGVGGVDQNNFASQRNAKLRSEVQLAAASTNRLSRLGASSTTIELARIRQYVHGVELINELNVSMYGEVGRLYAQSVFDNLYTILDTYDAKLASGQKVNDSLNALAEAITELSNLTNGILGYETAQ
ncbi:MAG: hypothetical protein E7320_06925 [Clostridiales bacterium]|nr:hypothetical protein [Clostridiales bacterium]